MSDCSGCRNDFYNGKNDLGVSVCWSLSSARMVTRFRLHVDTPMNRRSGYQKELRPHCYHESRYVFLDDIPDGAQ